MPYITPDMRYFRTNHKPHLCNLSTAEHLSEAECLPPPSTTLALVSPVSITVLINGRGRALLLLELHDRASSNSSGMKPLLCPFTSPVCQNPWTVPKVVIAGNQMMFEGSFGIPAPM